MVAELPFVGGGKSIDTDILQKRIEFFKTLNEHVQIIGNRVTPQGSISGATQEDTVYTVPLNKTAFLHTLSYENKNTGAGTNEDMAIKFSNVADQVVLRHNAPATSAVNKFIVFNPMLILFTGETLTISKNNANATHTANCRLILYEIPSEISIQ